MLETSREGSAVRIRTVVAAVALLTVAVSLLPAPAEAAYPGANGRLYFSTGRPRPLDIWWSDQALGLGPMPGAVNSSKDDWSHYWSPDGTKMIFQSNRDGDVEIFLFDSVSGSVTQLTHNKLEDSYASWSPVMRDGSLRVVFQRTTKNNQDIWVMNADGSGQTQLFGTKKNDFQAAWSPQGDEIAFVNASDGDEDIYALDVDLSATGAVILTGPVRNVTNNSSTSEYSPDWSPSGTQLVFVRESTRISQVSANANIWKMNADGTGQTLVTDHQLIDRQPDWSPDGTTIAFASGRDATDATWDIWTVDVNGESLARITNDEFPDFQPEWRNA